MRISDWSSDVCSSDLRRCCCAGCEQCRDQCLSRKGHEPSFSECAGRGKTFVMKRTVALRSEPDQQRNLYETDRQVRSEEHTSELQSLMRISYDVFCLKKKQTHTPHSTYKE